MKLSDYVVDFLVRCGIRHNFLVSGGAVIHLVDSSAKHPQMNCICSQHEQNGAASADGYARINGLGLVMTTSGPGATNIVTSVCNAYFDSVPLICITGQVARFRLRKTPKLRQRGFQETDVVAIFKSITKYASLVTDPEMIRYELEKGVFLATEGRPGPVLLDIPDDVQRVDIDPRTLKSFTPPLEKRSSPSREVASLFEMIRNAERPVLILGGGVHYGKSEKEAISFAQRLQMPVVFTWGGADLLPHADPLNMGVVGVCGPRGGNFALQYADLVIAIGTRLSQMITGGKQNLFAPLAKKAMVDIDAEELEKFGPETFVLDLPIHSDLSTFFTAAAAQLWDEADRFGPWRQQICAWRERYPICPVEFRRAEKVNPYVFIKEISRRAGEGDIIIGDTGANISWTMQAFEPKKNQRIFSAWNHTPMGYSLPAAIGATLACNGKRDVICLIGDGGLMMCLQELATVRRHDLPLKIFLFNNRGHGIQKQTIDTWLGSHYVAVDEASGLFFPDYEKIAAAFKLPYFHIANHDGLCKLEKIWQHEGPFLCDVEITENQKIVPMLKFGAGLEDLDPKLPPEEIAAVQAEVLIPQQTQKLGI